MDDKIVKVKVNWQYFDAANKPVYYQYIVKTDKHKQAENRSGCIHR